MMNSILPLVSELQHEARSTRIMLERVPDRSLPWKPHEKSRTGFDRNAYEAGEKDSMAGILAAFDRNIAASLGLRQKMNEEEMMAMWKYSVGSRAVFELPRIAVLRGMGINHLIHHRGQLSPYLRLLEVPVPGMYGPTADET